MVVEERRRGDWRGWRREESEDGCKERRVEMDVEERRVDIEERRGEERKVEMDIGE